MTLTFDLVWVSRLTPALRHSSRGITDLKSVYSVSMRFSGFVRFQIRAYNSLIRQSGSVQRWEV